MKTSLSLDKVVGRTIRGTFETSNDELVLVFTDGEYIALKSSCGYEGDRYAPEIQDLQFYYPRDVKAYLENGIVTHAQADEWLAKHEAAIAAQVARNEAQERETLARLKTKYEPL